MNENEVQKSVECCDESMNVKQKRPLIETLMARKLRLKKDLQVIEDTIEALEINPNLEQTYRMFRTADRY
jgi:hypothetical protein